MRTKQSTGKSPLFEDSFLSFGKGSKKPYSKILKKKPIQKVKSTATKKETSDKKPPVKDKTPLKSGSSRNADTGKPNKISPAHKKNIDAYAAKKASQSSKNAPSVNLEETTFTPKARGGIKQ